MTRFTASFDSLEALKIVHAALLLGGWSEEMTIPRANGHDVLLRFNPPNPVVSPEQGSKFLLSFNR